MNRETIGTHHLGIPRNPSTGRASDEHARIVRRETRCGGSESGVAPPVSGHAPAGS